MMQQAIIAVILDKFPDCDILPSYEKETGLHLFQMIFEAPDPTFHIKMPAGFLMTQIHVKKQKQVVFEMMIHEQIFIELYQMCWSSNKSTALCCA